MLLQRCPNGVSGPNFFQKRVPDSAPDGCETTMVSTPNGTTSRAIVVADLAHVLWAVNQAVPRVPRVAVPRRRTRPRPTSCASTSTLSRA